MEKYNMKTRSKGARELLEDLYKFNPFTKKQKKILLALTTFNPISIRKLEEKTKSKNIKSLVRDTNIRIKRNHLDDRIKIVSCYNALGEKGHYILIFKPFLSKFP